MVNYAKQGSLHTMRKLLTCFGILCLLVNAGSIEVYNPGLFLALGAAMLQLRTTRATRHEVIRTFALTANAEVGVKSADANNSPSDFTFVQGDDWLKKADERNSTTTHHFIRSLKELAASDIYRIIQRDKVFLEALSVANNDGLRPLDWYVERLDYKSLLTICNDAKTLFNSPDSRPNWFSDTSFKIVLNKFEKARSGKGLENAFMIMKVLIMDFKVPLTQDTIHLGLNTALRRYENADFKNDLTLEREPSSVLMTVLLHDAPNCPLLQQHLDDALRIKKSLLAHKLTTRNPVFLEQHIQLFDKVIEMIKSRVPKQSNSSLFTKCVLSLNFALALFASYAIYSTQLSPHDPQKMMPS